jgi:predicted aspartyl protease
MIRYRYSHHLSRPAPFLNVSIRCPDTGQRTTELPAQIDTGANRSVLPGPVVAALGLAEDGRETFIGFNSEIVALPLYLVEVLIHDLPPVQVRAVIGEREPNILLGRDVLNAYRLLLDGPALALEIG